MLLNSGEQGGMRGWKVTEKERIEGGETEADRQLDRGSTSPGQVPGCLFADAGVGPGDDDGFPIQPLL